MDSFSQESLFGPETAPEQGMDPFAPEAGMEEIELPPYEVTPEDRELVAEVEAKFKRWHEDRKPHEVQWFINAAFYRGRQYIQYDNTLHQIRSLDGALPAAGMSSKKRVSINLIFPKVRARLAKFLRGRPQPTVMPATRERKDKLNARASQNGIDYIWRKQRLEAKYKNALLWAKDTGKGYWWFHWNTELMARRKVQQPSPNFMDPNATTTQVVSEQIGDVEIEVGSPFEVLVADLSIAEIGEQPEIMRARLTNLEDAKSRYQDRADLIQPAAEHEEAFIYEKRISKLSAREEGFTLTPDEQTGTDKQGGNKNRTLTLELFARPSLAYPQGRYIVVHGGVVCENTELPWFGDMENPYPVEEFTDVPTVGQYWTTTIIEQLIGPQRQYNFIRNKIDQQLRLMMHPKLFVPRQMGLKANAFHSGAGEKITFNWIPGLPAPFVWTPPNVAADAWRALEVLKQEIVDITQIFPTSEGGTGDATSGYQTNLLQEASDSVHAPDARSHEMTVERAAWKIRRLQFLNYDVPRLININGRHGAGDAVEFSSANIDEQADIVVQSGSGLPTLKAARQAIFMQWYEKGIFGPIGSPEANKKFMTVAEAAGLEGMIDQTRRDEDLAQAENDQIAANEDIPIPQFYENHSVHYEVHTDELKNPEVLDWSEEKRIKLIAHTLLHFKYINPIAAANLAMEYGLDMLIGFGPGKIPPPPPPMPVQPAGEGGPAPKGAKPGAGAPSAPPPAPLT